MANFLSDAGTLPIPSQGIAVSTDGITYDIIPTGAETIITGTFKVNGGYNTSGQGGWPGVSGSPYATTTIVNVQHGAKKYAFELQDLKGGTLFTAGYNLGTNQNLADAIQLMNTW